MIAALINLRRVERRCRSLVVVRSSLREFGTVSWITSEAANVIAITNAKRNAHY